MDIDTRLRELGDVDTGRLKKAILALDDAAWHEEEYRQEAFDVHKQTQSVVLVFVNLDTWPEVEICKEPGWDRLADVAVPVMHDIIERHYPAGGTIVRAMAAKLVAGGRITPHSDTHPSFHIGHRIHVPITTNPRVRFMIDGRPHRLLPGQAYEINNQRNHSVSNKGAEDRITFIFDYIPPDKLADLARRQGRHSEQIVAP
ncbi:MAG: aspartyl/asparaginyl beta-hydroxylase domain-containing protein [Gammaproteobacteria bacterium]|nr:aspartyl/asparaginyl beta-hydroxylase domain-containing protein [Gammaproteobacteria bacterium]